MEPWGLGKDKVFFFSILKAFKEKFWLFFYLFVNILTISSQNSRIF